MPSGPHVQATCLCEKVLEEKDGVLSAIRMVDRINLQAIFPPGLAAPPEMPAFPVNLAALIALKAGDAVGSHTIQLVPRAPSGLKLPGPSVPILFDGGEDRGVNVVLRIDLQVKEQGLYWFDVLFDEALLSRIPLRVVFQPLTMNVPPQL